MNNLMHCKGTILFKKSTVLTKTMAQATMHSELSKKKKLFANLFLKKKNSLTL